VTAAAQLATFLAKYTPAVAARARAALRTVRKRFPRAVELVYDNYNGLAIGFGTTERPADLVFSVTLYPRWVSLFFVDGAGLADPHERLRGSGARIRHVVLEDAGTLDDPAVRASIDQAIARAGVPTARARRGRIVIQSVSTKQRPRRPR
jgi:hypothetical protein